MRKKVKRVLAIIMVIFLLSLYVWSFVAALQARPESKNVFIAAVFATICLPILLHIYIWVGDLLRGKGVDIEPEKEEKKEETNK